MKESFRGVFTKLMKAHPDVTEMVCRLGQKRRPKMPVSVIHRKMLVMLRKKGVQANAYPFNTLDCGRKSLARFLRECLDSSPISVRTAEKCPESATPFVTNDAAIEVKRIVRGNISQGRRPYVAFGGNIYHGRSISLTPSLIGRTVKICADPKDIRVISAYTTKGQFLENLSSSRLSILDHPLALEDQRRLLRERRQIRWADICLKEVIETFVVSQTKQHKDLPDDQ